MLTNIRYILITALRDWLFIGLFAGVIVAAGISALLGSTAFLEEKEMTVTLAAGSSRLILMTGLIVFVCFHIRQAFDAKEIDVILSRPISREALVIAYWAGFSFVALLLAVPVMALIGFLGATDLSGFAGWAATLWLESCLVVALALFSALTMKSAVASVLACMGFYVVSRMMAFFVVTAQSGLFSDMKFILLRYALTFISTVVPRLDFFCKSSWLVYGFERSEEWVLCVTQVVVFVPLLIAACIIDFKRKQF